jgi:hypothetical protein
VAQFVTREKKLGEQDEEIPPLPFARPLALVSVIEGKRSFATGRVH